MGLSDPLKEQHTGSQKTSVLFWPHCSLGWVTLAEPLDIPWPEFPSLGIIPVLPASQGCWKIDLSCVDTLPELGFDVTVPEGASWERALQFSF